MGGTAGIQVPLVIWHQVTGGLGTVSTYTTTRAGVIQDVRVIGGAGLGGGTMNVGTVGGSVTGNIPMNAVNTVARATTIVAANAAVPAGGTITFTRNAASTRGNVMVFYVPPLAGATVI